MKTFSSPFIPQPQPPFRQRLDLLSARAQPPFRKNSASFSQRFRLLSCKASIPLPAKAQQVAPRLAYLAVALSKCTESLPHRMPDDAEVAFEHDGILLLRRDTELAKVEQKPVQVAFQPIRRRFQAPYFLQILLLSPRLSLLLPRKKSLLRGRPVRALSAPLSEGTIEEGVCFALLCYALLCFVYFGTVFRCFQTELFPFGPFLLHLCRYAQHLHPWHRQ